MQIAFNKFKQKSNSIINSDYQNREEEKNPVFIFITKFFMLNINSFDHLTF